MFMFKKSLAALICLGLIVMFSLKAFAVPAAPVLHTLIQRGGIELQAKQWGDENINGWETEEGYAIVFDKALDGWAYAEHDPDGGLKSSGIMAGIHSAPRWLMMHARPKGKALSMVEHKRLQSPQAAEGISAAEATATLPALVPSTGTGNVATLLINFNDRTTTYTASNFTTLLFGTGNNSMKDFYQETSYGAFSVSAGPGGVAGWYAAANGHDFYGHNTGDTNAARLAREAVAAADAAGFDFAPYDQDGDCYVDVVNIVHQGAGTEASGSDTDIWSHSWNFSSAGIGVYTTKTVCPGGGNIRVNNYVMQPEMLWGGMTTMGVFAHEYGHALGLPDLYDTDYTSEGVGNWSLMAGGSWNAVSRQGDRPSHLDAWSKYKLGWVSPIAVTSGTLTNEPIQQAETSADIYRLLSGTPESGEYFLVENRQKTGFDAGLPGAGLLVWHIDAAQASNRNECYPGGPSCATQHYKVALVQADNLWEMEQDFNRGNGGDPYPGSTSNTSFTSTTSPNSNLYNGSASGVSITSISASNATMTATLTVATSCAITTSSLASGKVGVAYSATLTATGGTTPYAWSITSGSLPAGLTLASSTGVISGTPTVAGTFSFTVKVTDNVGQTASKALSITIAPAPTVPSITVTSPNGGNTLYRGSVVPITWSYTANPGANVKIELYNGTTLSRTIALSTPLSTGTYNWTIPSTQTLGSSYKIKVTSTTNSAYSDTSNSAFTIATPSITVTAPNGGESYTRGTVMPITWKYGGNPGANVKILLYKGLFLSRTLTLSTSLSAGKYNWTVPSTQAVGSTYKIKIISTTNSSYSDSSNASFTIK
jgi:M6 family metalloprotease-like protein